MAALRVSSLASSSLLAGFLFAGLMVPAAAATIGFENVVSNSNDAVFATPYDEAGFTLVDKTYVDLTSPPPLPPPAWILGSSSEVPFTPTTISANTNGTSVFGWCAYCFSNSVSADHFELTADNSLPFSLLSLDIANLEFVSNESSPYSAAQSLHLVGNLSAGGTVETTLSLTNTWTTQALLGFDNLTSVDFYAAVTDGSAPDVAIDNLTLSSAPLPGALPLFASGLGALGLFGWRKRKKAVATA